MSERCPKCYARVGRCDCADTDPEMLAERLGNAEKAVVLLATAILDGEGLDQESWIRTVLRPAAEEARDRIGAKVKP